MKAIYKCTAPLNLSSVLALFLQFCDKVYQLLTHGQWFSPASSTTKTGRHDIVEILLKVA
jgi:hypothetical protein